jgi:hypothetical protein
MAEASKKAKSNTFFKHFTFKGATSHIDDKYGIDVDDIFNVKEILSSTFTEQFELKITPTEDRFLQNDKLNVGYLKLDKIV